MPIDTAEWLSKDELVRFVRAMRAMAQLSSELELTSIVPALVRIAAQATDSDGSAMYLLNEAGTEFVHAASYPELGPAIEPYRRFPVEGTRSGEVLAAAKARAYADADLGAAAGALATVGYTHVALVPLRFRMQPAGTLHLLRGDGRAFSDRDLRFAEIMADQIAIVVQNTRLYSDAQRRVVELRMLVDVGRAITASLELDRILQTSAEILAQIVRAANAFILLLDAERNALRVVSAHSSLAAHLQITVVVPESRSVAWQAVRTGRPVVVEDISTSDAVNKQLAEQCGHKSVLALPLLVRDEPIGAVIIGDSMVRRWSGPELERAEVITHQLAIAVANARLFQTLRQSYGDLARAQEALINRERLAALGQLAATIAHEVRNPVGVLFNSLGTLSKTLKPTGDAAMLLQIMREEADRLNHLVGDLLDFARPLDPTLGLEPLDGVIQDAVEAVRNDPAAAAVEVRAEIASNLPSVQIDPRLMRRALLNLLLNGAQAMPRGGTLTVRASADTDSARPVARIDVIDSGAGIAPEVAARMFEPFFTTKASGTGLGLAVVKSIVDAHRGEITFASTPNQGTTFTVRLPIVRESPPPTPAW